MIEMQFVHSPLLGPVIDSVGVANSRIVRTGDGYILYGVINNVVTSGPGIGIITLNLPVSFGILYTTGSGTVTAVANPGTFYGVGVTSSAGGGSQILICTVFNGAGIYVLQFNTYIS
jgi:hypothetical protein